MSICTFWEESTGLKRMEMLMRGWQCLRIQYCLLWGRMTQQRGRKKRRKLFRQKNGVIQEEDRDKAAAVSRRDDIADLIIEKSTKYPYNMYEKIEKDGYESVLSSALGMFRETIESIQT